MEELKINQKEEVFWIASFAEFFSGPVEIIDYLPESVKCASLQKKLFMWFFFSVFLDTTMNKMLKYYIEEKDNKFKK